MALLAGLDFPIICPQLIGRSEELTALEAFVLAREAARVNTILLTGEAGIGKSRLAGALAEKLSERGWGVLEMSCYEQHQTLPYAGVIDLLQRLIRRDEDFVAARMKPVLGTGVLGSLLPGFAASAPAPDEDPVQQRERILAGVLELVSGVTSEAPCLLVVEDLHWCDPNTLASLLHLARYGRELPLTLLITLRPEEGGREVEGFLADLERERLSSELRLSPLTLSETDEMLKAILQTERSTSIELLHGLYRLTEGNPFYVEEVMRSLIGGSSDAVVQRLQLDQARIPRTVLEVVGQRVEALSPTARSLLETAAVVGVRFDVSVFEALSGREERDVLAALRELVEAQLIVEGDEDDSFAFRHALTREAVASRLLKREKAQLHARIAAQLESRDAASHIEELSYHYFEAGDWQKAQVYAEQAGARALAMYAPAIALEHFNRAIEAASQEGVEASSTAYRGRASAFEAAGEFERARDDLEHAIVMAERRSDSAALVDALLDLGLLWSSRDYAKALSYYARAVDVARELSEQGRLARALSRLANGLSNTGSFDEALSYLQEALAIQRELDDRRGVAATLDLIGMTGLMSGRFAESLTAYRDALALMEDGDKRNRLSVLASIPVLSGTYQSAMLAPALSVLDARPYAEEAVTIARELGVPSDLSYTLWQVALWLGPQGRTAEALAMARESLKLAIDTGHKQWETAARGVLGAILTDLLQPEAAEHELRQALALTREINSSLWEAQMSNFLVDALLSMGRLQEAAGLLGMEDGRAQEEAPRSMSEVWLLAAEAEVAFARREFERVRRVVETIALSRTPGLKLERLQGLMALREGRLDESASILSGVASSAAEQGNRSIQWRALCDLAHCYIASEQREQARSAASEALQAVDVIAAQLDDPEAFRRAAALMLPASLRQRPARTAASLLTSREAEVAGLIAAGLTNRDIAERLVLSSRTVETHVANAMSKLGFSTRSQLAAWHTGHRNTAQ